MVGLVCSIRNRNFVSGRTTFIHTQGRRNKGGREGPLGGARRGNGGQGGGQKVPSRFITADLINCKFK